VIVRSAPIQCKVVPVCKVEKKRSDSPRSPPVVPPIREDEEEELPSLIGRSVVLSKSSILLSPSLLFPCFSLQ
jgi:hypothetical protein